MKRELLRRPTEALKCVIHEDKKKASINKFYVVDITQSTSR
jgi:hypothetical protein